MPDVVEISKDWTKPEIWAWEQIESGEIADFNARDREENPDFKDLDPSKEEGWGDNRRLNAKFLQTILTKKDFADATPYGGVRIFGALIDDASLDLEHARLQRLFWLEQSRILVDINGRNLRIDGEFSPKGSYVAGNIILSRSNIRESLHIDMGKFQGLLDLLDARIGSFLEMSGSTFEKSVDLNSTVISSAFLRRGATFKGAVDFGAASIGSAVDMSGSTFEGVVSLNGATVNGAVFLNDDATFKGAVDFGAASIGSTVDMSGSTFQEVVSLNDATINGSVLLGNGATFKGKVYLGGCKVTGALGLGSSQHKAAIWEDGAVLVLRNTQIAVLQDWWRDDSDNSWPTALHLDGFTYDRLGATFSDGVEADMMARPAASYIEWLRKDPNSSSQPYEQLARVFRQAGEPHKANDILYEARERRRRMAFSNVDSHGQAKDRNWREGLGLTLLRLTVGYGLGSRYFRVLWFVGGTTILGMLLLIIANTHFWDSLRFLYSVSLDQLLLIISDTRSWERLAFLFFASLDQLLPIITLDKAHELFIFGDPKTNPIAGPQPYWLEIYFYVHKIVGWVLGSFIVAGLSGLTQRN